MCSDFKNLERELHELEKAGIDGIHIDVMDGHFVPNFALGPDIARAVARMTDLEVEVHLMVERPEYYIDLFSGCGIDRIQVHAESTTNLLRLLQSCAREFEYVDIVANPLTPLCMIEDTFKLVSGVCVMTVEPGFAGQDFAPGSLPRIRRIKESVPELGFRGQPFSIEADGHVNLETIGGLAQAGVTSVVLGSSGLYKVSGGFSEAVRALAREISVASED